MSISDGAFAEDHEKVVRWWCQGSSTRDLLLTNLDSTTDRIICEGLRLSWHLNVSLAPAGAPQSTHRYTLHI